MLFDEKAVRENLRNRDGKRVFYLGKGDTLSPSARDFLNRERIEILPADSAKPDRWRLADGSFRETKGEAYTCLEGDLLVRKTHPRIRFRGAMDSLEAELLLVGPETRELLELARKLIRCEVLEEPMGEFSLYGLSEAQQRQHSHFPQDHYGIPHFMPDYSDGEQILVLNRCRTAARAAELAAAEAFTDSEGNLTREDIIRALNRMSSMHYILILKHKKLRIEN